MCETYSIGAHVTKMQGNTDQSGSDVIAPVHPKLQICGYDGHTRTYQTLEEGIKTIVHFLGKTTLQAVSLRLNWIRRERAHTHTQEDFLHDSTGSPQQTHS